MYIKENDKTLEDLDNMTLKTVEKVYSGKEGACCCGCSGKYWYSPIQPNLELDYPTSAKMVNKVIKLIKENRDHAEFGMNYISITIGNRWYIAYFDK